MSLTESDAEKIQRLTHTISTLQDDLRNTRKRISTLEAKAFLAQAGEMVGAHVNLSGAVGVIRPDMFAVRVKFCASKDADNFEAVIRARLPR